MAKKEQSKKLKGVKMTTPPFRVSFPRLFEPKSYKDGKPKYSVTALFPKDSDRSEMNKAIMRAARELFGKDKEQWPESFRKPWRNGDRKKDYAGYADHVYVVMNTLKAPGVIDQKKNRIESEDDKNGIYPGCYARAVVVLKAYENGSNAGVTVYLQHIQKYADGEPFDGRTSAEDEFDEIESDEDDDVDTDDDDSDDEDAPW